MPGIMRSFWRVAVGPEEGGGDGDEGHAALLVLFGGVLGGRVDVD